VFSFESTAETELNSLLLLALGFI